MKPKDITKERNSEINWVAVVLTSVIILIIVGLVTFNSLISQTCEVEIDFTYQGEIDISDSFKDQNVLDEFRVDKFEGTIKTKLPCVVYSQVVVNKWI